MATRPSAVRWIATLLLLCGCLHPTRLPRATEPTEPTLAVLTYNVNYGLAGDPDTVDAIASSKADVIFLQEANAEWRDAAAKTLAKRWPYQRWLDAPAAGGQAVLSRWPFSEPELLESPTGWFFGLRVEARTPLGRVQVLSVHLHPPVTERGSWVAGYFSTGGVRRTEIETFAESLRADLPTLVVGDFNEGTSGDAVSWLEHHGLRSALPEYSPKAKTWRWREGPLKLSAQFDHLAYDDRLEPLHAEVLPLGNSDHLPVRAVFTLATAETVRPSAPQGTSLSISLAP